MKVVCVGHATYDTTLPMDFYPTENLKYRIKEHTLKLLYGLLDHQ